jgi:predicted RNase H-like nuclease
MSTIGDDLLRESSAAFGPKIEALIVYNSNPVAVAPESVKVVRGFQRDDLTDAFAALWSGRRIATGAAKVLGSQQRDQYGLKMEMWA